MYSFQIAKGWNNKTLQLPIYSTIDILSICFVTIFKTLWTNETCLQTNSKHNKFAKVLYFLFMFVVKECTLIALCYLKKNTSILKIGRWKQTFYSNKECFKERNQQIKNIDFYTKSFLTFSTNLPTYFTTQTLKVYHISSNWEWL